MNIDREMDEETKKRKIALFRVKVLAENTARMATTTTDFIIAAQFLMKISELSSVTVFV